jgi:hypothetical protein
LLVSCFHFGFVQNWLGALKKSKRENPEMIIVNYKLVEAAEWSKLVEYWQHN